MPSSFKIETFNSQPRENLFSSKQIKVKEFLSSNECKYTCKLTSRTPRLITNAFLAQNISIFATTNGQAYYHETLSKNILYYTIMP